MDLFSSTGVCRRFAFVDTVPLKPKKVDLKLGAKGKTCNNELYAEKSIKLNTKKSVELANELRQKRQVDANESTDWPTKWQCQ